MSVGRMDARERARIDAEIAMDRAVSTLAVADGLICDLSLMGTNPALLREIENLAAVIAASNLFMLQVKEFLSVET